MILISAGITRAAVIAADAMSAPTRLPILLIVPFLPMLHEVRNRLRVFNLSPLYHNSLCPSIDTICHILDAPADTLP